MAGGELRHANRERAPLMAMRLGKHDAVSGDGRAYWDLTVERADPGVQTCSGIVGWSLYAVEGGGTWLTFENCAEQPQPGERIRYYGRGFGFPIEGIEIGGRVYR